MRNSSNTFNNYEINPILTWFADCVISFAIYATKYATSDTKRYALVITLLTQDNIKLLQQFQFGFKRTINWININQKTRIEGKNSYLDFLIEQSFQVVHRVFVFPFEYQDENKPNTMCFVAKVEIKVFNVMIDGQNFFKSTS